MRVTSIVMRIRRHNAHSFIQLKMERQEHSNELNDLEIMQRERITSKT